MKLAPHRMEHAKQYNKNAIRLESRALRMLLTTLRAKQTRQPAFVAAADRLCAILAEEALALLPDVVDNAPVMTPCGPTTGMICPPDGDVVVVDIVRSGGILQEAVRRACPGAGTAKILVQRDEATALPSLLYSKLPPGVASKNVVLCDPMLATGGSAMMALGVLRQAGVRDERVVFANVVSCPEGLRRLASEAPDVRIVTCAVDAGLNDQKFIVPGLGDFGDRYFGTFGYDEGLWGCD